jgi:hypothetical protein
VRFRFPGVNCRERTREDLLDTLKLTLREALGPNRPVARKAAGEEFEEAPIAVGNARRAYGISGDTAASWCGKAVGIPGGTILHGQAVGGSEAQRDSTTAWRVISAATSAFLR